MQVTHRPLRDERNRTHRIGRVGSQFAQKVPNWMFETRSDTSSLHYKYHPYYSTEWCKNIPARFRERLAEILRQSAILRWAAEHFESDSLNLSGMCLHNSVYSLNITRALSRIQSPHSDFPSGFASVSPSLIDRVRAKGGPSSWRVRFPTWSPWARPARRRRSWRRGRGRRRRRPLRGGGPSCCATLSSPSSHEICRI